MPKVDIDNRIYNAVCFNTKMEGKYAQYIRGSLITIYMEYIRLIRMYIIENDYNSVYNVVRMICSYTDMLIESGIAMNTLVTSIHDIVIDILIKGWNA